MQPGPSASAASKHSQHLPLVNTHCELKLHILRRWCHKYLRRLHSTGSAHLSSSSHPPYRVLSSRPLSLSFLLISLASPLSFFVYSAGSCWHAAWCYTRESKHPCCFCTDHTNSYHAGGKWEMDKPIRDVGGAGRSFGAGSREIEGDKQCLVRPCIP